MITLEGHLVTPDEAAKIKKFGAWLKQQRLARSYATGTPRYKLAEMAGINDATWKNYENGGRNFGGNWTMIRPSPETLLAIAKVLDIPPAEMFRRAGVRMPEHLKGVAAPPVAELPTGAQAVVTPEVLEQMLKVLSSLVQQTADLDQRMRQQEDRKD